MIKRYTSKTFRDDIVYVEWNGEESYLVTERYRSCLHYSQEQIERLTARGEWKEWPFDKPWSLQGIQEKTP